VGRAPEGAEDPTSAGSRHGEGPFAVTLSRRQDYELTAAFCIVTGSVRQGISVHVEVTPTEV
jgi:hypothetical protein